ncbi:TonB-dependent receptor [Sphingopyxis witflariensis]|uniref:TonB-dependent receptor n=1 Tax=Sphingopyxis witflariensis TaxID=173675 RepID=A0A246JTQ0_9SPHN|nr:TonB-dependent receptor [Sphingopyxis witflariensis]OWQ96384.1 TonB-dependent receptor [Sphingopyxis witflariensis]
MTEYRRALKCMLLAGSTLGAMAGANSAAAQDVLPDGASTAQVEEIVVTARRREESLQDVPISVTAFTADALDLKGAPDITALQRSTPNLTLQVSRGTNSTLTAFIRGIGQQDPLWGFEPGVGLYVDDIYIARPQGAVLDIFDIERIEVLRGPQGTLYGRNTIGGAVKYVTKRLGHDFSGKVRGEVGSYNEYNLTGSVALPVSDAISVGAAFAWYNRDGYGKNYFTGADTNNKNVIAGRLSVEIAPSDDIFIRLAADRTEDRSNGNHGHRELREPNSNTAVLPGRYDTLAGVGDQSKVVTQGLSLTGEWSVSDVITLKSITAYRDGYSSGDGIDFDGTPQPFLDIASSGKVYQDRQFSQEFQAQIETDRLQGVLGVYYLDAKASGAFDTILGRGLIPEGLLVPRPSAGTALTQLTSGSVDTESFAIFGDMNYDLTERLKLSLGARWTRDKKDGTVFKANYFGTLGSPLLKPYVPALPPPFNVPQILTDYSNSRTFEEFTPRVSLTYAASDDVNIYAAYGRGFKSGGFDMRGDATATPATKDGYDAEIVDSYELGFKGDFLDGQFRMNAAVFYTDYAGQQVTTQVPKVTPPPGVVSFVDNVGSSRIWGAELEAQAVLSRDFSANFSFGYINAKFNEFIVFDLATGQNVDVANLRRFQNTPKFTGSVSLNWQADFMGGRMAVLPSISFRSDTHLFEIPIPSIDQDGYALVDLSVTWTSPDEHWRLGVHGRNLFDVAYRTGGYNFPSNQFAQSVIGFYGPPRTARISAEYRF